MTVSSRLVIFTRFPEPGIAKTRLIPRLGKDRAALLHKRLTERTLETVRATGERYEVRTTGAAPEAFRSWLDNVRILDQGEGDLGARMARVFAEGPAIIVGSDIPDMTADHLRRAGALLGRHDVVIGPAEDGGYWLIGMKRPISQLFDDMPWGTAEVLSETRRRAAIFAIDLAETDRLRDLDTPSDLKHWPDLLP